MGRVEEPGRQQRAIVSEEALELAVEQVRDSVIVRVATRPPVRLHQRLRGLERIPARVPRTVRRGPLIASGQPRDARSDTFETAKALVQAYETGGAHVGT